MQNYVNMENVHDKMIACNRCQNMAEKSKCYICFKDQIRCIATKLLNCTMYI